MHQRTVEHTADLMPVGSRKLEKTSAPGVYRRHTGTCKRDGRCRCQYVVRWKERGVSAERVNGMSTNAAGQRTTSMHEPSLTEHDYPVNLRLPATGQPGPAQREENQLF